MDIQQLQPQQLKEIYEQERIARVNQCAQEVKAVLDKYDCVMEPSVEILGTQIIAQVKFFPR